MCPVCNENQAKIVVFFQVYIAYRKCYIFTLSNSTVDTQLSYRLQPTGTGIPQLARLLLNSDLHPAPDRIGPSAAGAVAILSVLRCDIASSQVKNW